MSMLSDNAAETDIVDDGDTDGVCGPLAGGDGEGVLLRW